MPTKLYVVLLYLLCRNVFIAQSMENQKNVFCFQLIYSLQHYKGDERIKEFIWDLVSPAGEASLKNHSGKF